MAIGLAGLAWWYSQHEDKGISTFDDGPAFISEPLSNITNPNTNSATNGNTNSTVDTTGWKTYTDGTIGVSFKYSNQYTVSNRDLTPETGRATQIRFLTSSGDERFNLNYSTSDYTRGASTWITERTGNITSENMAGFCTATLPLNIVKKYCQIGKLNGKNYAKIFSEVDALDGENVLGFYELYFFETGVQDYPVGVISMEFPLVNQYQKTANNVWIGLPLKNTSAIDLVYNNLNNRTADAETNNALQEFDTIISTFNFTN